MKLMNTQQLIKEYEGRLEVGFEKLRAMELSGQWDEAMYMYWLQVESEYKQLCRPPMLFENYPATPTPVGAAQSR
jgi:hypothetical protein